MTELIYLCIWGNLECGPRLDYNTCIIFRFVSSSNGEKWTHSYVLSPCSTDEECFPIEYHNITIPPSLISCDISTGLCECQQCFVRRNNICAVNTNACNSYMTETQKCSDDRKSQRTALLLSFFLSAAGAANFYIGQNLLGLLFCCMFNLKFTCC